MKLTMLSQILERFDKQLDYLKKQFQTIQGEFDAWEKGQ